MVVYTERGDSKAFRFALKWIGISNATFVSLTEEGNPAMTCSVPRVPIEEDEPEAYAKGRADERARVVSFVRAEAKEWQSYRGHDQADALTDIADAIERGEHLEKKT
jgi:hypothetical protein